MKVAPSIVASVGLLSLIAATPAVDDVAFGPEDGTTLTKSFSITTDFGLEELSIVVDGQDFSEMLGSLELEIGSEETIVVTDEYVESGSPRPARLRRTFDKLESTQSFSFTSDFGSEEDSADASSDLEGSTVLFTWDDEEGAFEITFDDEEGDGDLLEGLEEDMDFRAFLPAEDVSEGDTWQIEPQELDFLLAPGGSLSIHPDDVDEEDLDIMGEVFDEDFETMLEDALQGQAECKYLGMRDEDGVSLAVIEVAIEIASSFDLTSFLDELMAEVGDELDGEISFDLAEMEIEFEGEGTLLWNPRAGHMHSFELSGDAWLGATVAVSGEMDGESGKAEFSASVAGTLVLDVTTEE